MAGEKKTFRGHLTVETHYEIQADSWEEALAILKTKDESKMEFLGRYELTPDYVEEAQDP